MDFPWFFRINVLAVFAAAVLYMALGFVWFSKLAFGPRWLRLSGKTEADMEGGPSALTLAGVFLQCGLAAFALAWVISRSNSWTLLWGAKVGLILGVGVAVSTLATDAAFHGRSRGLLAVNAGYHLTGMLLMGALLGAWNG